MELDKRLGALRLIIKTPDSKEVKSLSLDLLFPHIKVYKCIDILYLGENIKGDLMEDITISIDLNKNEEYLKNTIGWCFDTNYHHFIIPAYDNSEALIVYMNRIADTNAINNFILKPLMSLKEVERNSSTISKSEAIKILINSEVYISGVRESSSWQDICDSIMIGNSVIFINDCDKAIILSTYGFKSREVVEPATESETRGPRDGFIEDIGINTALIRRRIKDYSLRFENMIIGERTKTVVALAYIDNIVNKSVLDEARIRLKRIKIDGILETGYLEELITDAPYSIFPLIHHTERPDKVCASILEGRIAILVDNTPFVMIIPTEAWAFLHGSGDYYESYYISSLVRIIRVIAIFLGISLSSLYVLLMSFHQEMIPTSLALKIATGREGVPFPIAIEAFGMELVFEILKEAGIRMPSSVGQTVSFIGALVIGEAAVAAGLIGPATVIVISLAAICSFAIPSFTMNNSVRLIRFPLLILSSTLGILGYLGGIIAIDLHLMSLRSFGAPYMAPMAPFDISSNKDVFIRVPWWKMGKRPSESKTNNREREKKDMNPKPPEKNNN
jgi:spore germination protein KA